MTYFKMDYYRTYYFTNICDSVIDNTFNYVATLNQFWGEGKFAYFLKPFSKYSVLHQYIDFCINRLIYESNSTFEKLELDELKKKKFWINEAMKYHGLKYESFGEWLKTNNNSSFSDDLLNEYFFQLEMSDAFSLLKNQMVEETFYVLFLNRKFLNTFNLEMSEMFKVQELDDFDKDSLYLLKKNGTLKRKTIPKWATRAVFYRDRGKCTMCNKDLTGLFNISNKFNIDHIIPLAINGLNDVSNLQLLCDSCNSSKGGRICDISTNYEKWY